MKEKLTDERWINRGNDYLKSEKFTDALECFQAAISVNPNNAVAWFKKGYVLHEQEKYDEALPCYDKAMILDPSLEEVEDKRIDLILDMGPDDDDEELVKNSEIDSLPDLWKKFMKRKGLAKIKSTVSFRIIGVMFIFAAILSFLFFLYSLKYIIQDWGALISTLLNLFSAFVWFKIAVNFEMIADYLKPLVAEKGKDPK